MTENDSKSDSSEKDHSGSNTTIDQQHGSVSSRQSTTTNDRLHKNDISDTQNFDKIESELSIKDYYNALDDPDNEEASFSSLPGFIINTLLNADDDTFAEFLATRKLSKDASIDVGQDISGNSDLLKKGDDINSIEQSEIEVVDNIYQSDNSSDPPPLVLPPINTVKYDDSFIEMVIRVVNQRRNKNSTSGNASNLNANSKGKGKGRAVEEDQYSPRIEQARRERLPMTEDTLLLDRYSVKEDELLFLTDNKIPSFLYNDNTEQNTSECSKAHHEHEKYIMDRLEHSSYAPQNLYDDSFVIHFDDVLDQSCNSIEVIHLGDEIEERVPKGGSVSEEDDTEFFKDYSSMLCFDDETNGVTFKEKCDTSNIENTNRQIYQEFTPKQGSSDSNDKPKSDTIPISPLNVLQEELSAPTKIITEYNSKREEREEQYELQCNHNKVTSSNDDLKLKPLGLISKNDEMRDARVHNDKSDTAEVSVMRHSNLKKEIQEISKTRKKAEKYEHVVSNEELELEESSSSLNSLNIESYIIATSTPSRNDSQQTNKEIFKTTPAKRRSEETDDYSRVNNASSSKTISPINSTKTDYRSSPVRRRLLEAHAHDSNRNTTPSPPLVFPQNTTKNNYTTD